MGQVRRPLRGGGSAVVSVMSGITPRAPAFYLVDVGNAGVDFNFLDES